MLWTQPHTQEANTAELRSTSVQVIITIPPTGFHNFKGKTGQLFPYGWTWKSKEIDM